MVFNTEQGFTASKPEIAVIAQLYKNKTPRCIGGLCKNFLFSGNGFLLDWIVGYLILIFGFLSELDLVFLIGYWVCLLM